MITVLQAKAFDKIGDVTLPNGLPMTQYRLSNGLQIYVIKNAAAPVFSFQTWFNVGSVSERLDPKIGRNGLAHFFEHLMFRGTTRVPDGEFDEVLTRAGVNDENATTWLDRTNYYQSLPKEALELVMDLESDRMTSLNLDSQTVESERAAVIGEYRIGLDDPDSTAYDKLYAAAFVSHPYQYTTIGTEDEIRSFTLADARYFYKTYYAPNNAVVLVVGDVVPDEVVALAAKYYGAIASQPIPVIPAPVEPAQTFERQIEFRHGQLIGSKVLIGFHIPEARHADSPSLLVAQAMLALGDGAMLNASWVRTGIASAISSDLNQLKDPGLFILGADLQYGHDSMELMGALDRSLSQLAVGVFTDGDLERARNQVLLRAYQQWSENGSLASYLGEFIASTGSPHFAIDLLKAVETVSKADIQRMAANYLNSTNRTVVVGKPIGQRSTGGERR